MPHLHRYGPSPAPPTPAVHSPYPQQPSFYGHLQPLTVGPTPYGRWSPPGYGSPPSHGQPHPYDTRPFQTPVPPYRPTFDSSPRSGHGFASSAGQYRPHALTHGNPLPESRYPGQYARRPWQHGQDLVRPPLAQGMKAQVKRHGPTTSLRSDPPPSRDAGGPGTVANKPASVVVEEPDEDDDPPISDPFPNRKTLEPAERVARAISIDPTGWETFDTLLSVPLEEWDCPSRYIRRGNLAETSKDVRETARWPAIQDDPAFRNIDLTGRMIPIPALRRAVREDRARLALDAGELVSTPPTEAASPVGLHRQGKDPSSRPLRGRAVSAVRAEENTSSKVERPRTDLGHHGSPMDVDDANGTQTSPDSDAPGPGSIPVSRRGSVGYESSRPSPHRYGQRSKGPSPLGWYRPFSSSTTMNDGMLTDGT